MDDEQNNGYTDKLKWIEDSWAAAGDEVFLPYVEGKIIPSDAVLEAFSSIYGTSHNGVLRMIAYSAKAQGKTFLSNYLPA